MPTFGSSRCQPMPRPPAFRQIFHEAIQSSAGQNLSTPRWPGNPTPSRRHFTHSITGLHSLLMTWTRSAAGDRHDASQHSSSDVCSPTEQRDVLAPQRATSQAPSSSLTAATPRQSSTGCHLEEVDDSLVDEDPPVPHMFPDRFEEEENECELPEHEVPEPEMRKRRRPSVLNRFLALHVVFGDGLRRTPCVGVLPLHHVCQVQEGARLPGTAPVVFYGPLAGVSMCTCSEPVSSVSPMVIPLHISGLLSILFCV